LLLSLLVTVGASVLVGSERTFRDRNFNLPSLVLVAVSAHVFTILSIELGGKSGPAGLAAAAVLGVGLWGLGLLQRSKSAAAGSSAVATFGVATAIGIAAALSGYELVVIVTAISVVVSWSVPLANRILGRQGDWVNVYITTANTDAAEDNVLDIFDELDIAIETLTHERTNKTERTIIVATKLTKDQHKSLSEILVNEKGVLSFKYTI